MYIMGHYRGKQKSFLRSTDHDVVMVGVRPRGVWKYGNILHVPVKNGWRVVVRLSALPVPSQLRMIHDITCSPAFKSAALVLLSEEKTDERRATEAAAKERPEPLIVALDSLRYLEVLGALCPA